MPIYSFEQNCTYIIDCEWAD